MQDLKSFFMKYDAFILFFFVLMIFTSCEEKPRDERNNKVIVTDGCVERFVWSGDPRYYGYLKLKNSNTKYKVDMCCDDDSAFWSSEIESAFNQNVCYRITHEYYSSDSRLILSAKIISNADTEQSKRPTLERKELEVKPKPFLNPEEIPEIKPSSKPIIIILQDGDDKKILKDFKDTLKKYEDSLESDRIMLEESNI